MSLEKVHAIMDDYALWRGTEVVAKQDVEDAEFRAVAADLRLQEARDALRDVSAKLSAIEDELAEAVDQHTAPSPLLYLTSDL